MNKKGLIIIIVLLLFMLAVSPTIYATVKTKESIDNQKNGHVWSIYMHDAKHTGRSPYSTENNDYLIKWTFWTDFGIDTSPAIDKDGIIYVTSKDDFLYALYPNGTEKWSAEYGDYIES